MKNLLLLRHAKSSWVDLDLPDIERSLNNRGRRDAPEMGKRFQRRGLSFDLVLCSPARRTRETCFGIAEGMGINAADDRIAYHDRIYEASPQTLLTLILSQPDNVGSLLLIGHNPGMEELANQLSPEPIGHMPTCAAVYLRFDTETWAEVNRAEPELLFYDFPKRKPAS